MPELSLVVVAAVVLLEVEPEVKKGFALAVVEVACFKLSV